MTTAPQTNTGTDTGNKPGSSAAKTTDILVLGAGRSATALIAYLGKLATDTQWSVTIADASAALLAQKCQQWPALKTLQLDLADSSAADRAISQARLVISLLPPPLHPEVAVRCLEHHAHLITASYVSPAMQAFDAQARERGLLFLNECGLDPGIDHLSAMQMIEAVKAEGHQIVGFKSYCGGLIAPESDNNPWGYKFTWNPMNVVLAGQGGISQYLQDGQVRYLPWHQLFGQTERISTQAHGDFDAYPNRDSLSYMPIYGLSDCPTFLRGTLRKQGYADAWLALVQLGYTDNTFKLQLPQAATWAWLTASFLPGTNANDKAGLINALADRLHIQVNSPVIARLDWLGLFDQTPIDHTTSESASPAELLLHLLLNKWSLSPGDKDMVVMQHQLIYQKADGQTVTHVAELVTIGQDESMTAMAMGVGYPLGIAAKLILTGQINDTGVRIPLTKAYYEPMLTELAALGLGFVEYEN